MEAAHMGAKAPVAHFASLRSDLLVVESPARPQYAGGREVGIEPGKYHQFVEHRCVVTGKDSIEHMRSRAHAPDSPGIWEMEASDVMQVTDLLAELATAEIDRVREILRDEEDGPNRQVITDVCRRVLVRSNVSERKPGERVTVSG
jgi:hypothetical protein